ncbi:hypothetical protein KY325_00225 [Candidatus Woesearchaeota archaeon]|nr:hypothetical protein [Candidatus Woesearchaeota archaeon]MBW3017572.1 hypothetical protein [Candidatus Woesearchaeota archaeon]
MAILEEKLFMTKQVGNKYLNIVQVRLELTYPHYTEKIFQLRLSDHPDERATYENFAPSPLGDYTPLEAYKALFQAIATEQDFIKMKKIFPKLFEENMADYLILRIFGQSNSFQNI